MLELSVNCTASNTLRSLSRGKVPSMSQEEFSLPTTLTTLTGKLVRGRHTGKHVAHCLDFDLVEIADTEDEVWDRLTATIITYVEFGLSKGWSSSIRHRAPDRFWNVLTPQVPVKFMPPITIANKSVPVIEVAAPNEALCAA